MGISPRIKADIPRILTARVQGLLLNDDKEVDHACFELAMRFQLAEYSQRLLANKMQQALRSENEFAPVRKLG